MGLFDSSGNGASGWMKKMYSDNGMDMDNEFDNYSPPSNSGTKMYCTMCHRIYNGGYKCPSCNNLLVEWDR